MTDDDPTTDLLPGFVPEDHYAPPPSPQIICFRCERRPSDIPGLSTWAAEDGYSTVDEMAEDDGTYNPDTNRFCCDECYIAIGMPSSPTGWRAP